jgi:hypothetical protein
VVQTAGKSSKYSTTKLLFFIHADLNHFPEVMVQNR